VGHEIERLAPRVDDHHALRGRRAQPPLDRGADVGARVPLAESSAEGESHHLVEAARLVEGGGGAGAHVDPGPAAQLHVAGLLEVAVGERHGVRMEPEPAREHADGRQPLAGGDGPPEDLQLQLREELVVKRHSPPAAQHEVHA
jgi:hypothetical protein